MKHCPNPNCSYRWKNRKASEYADRVSRCVDCGSALVEGRAALLKDAGYKSGPLRLPQLRRLGVTIGAILLVMFSGEVELLPFGGVELDPRGETKLFSLGLTAFFSAFLLVDLAALIVPRWRRHHAGSRASWLKLGRISLALTFVLATLQAWTVVVYLQYSGISTSAQVFAAAQLVIGVGLLLMLVLLVSRHGLGDGLSVVFGGWVARHLYEAMGFLVDQSRLARPLLKPIQLIVFILALVALWQFARWMFRLHRDREGEVRWMRLVFRLPLCGVVPFLLAAELLVVPFAISNLLGVPAPWWITRLVRGTTEYLLVSVPLILVLGVGCSLLFHRPKAVVSILERLSGAQPGLLQRVRRFLRPTVIYSLIFLAVLIGFEVLIDRVLSGSFLFDVVVLVVGSAIWLDLHGEWQFRRRYGELQDICLVHRVDQLDSVVDLLAAEGIHGFARAVHHRAMYFLLAPFLPMRVLVPLEQAEKAERILGARLSASPGPTDSGG